MSILLFFLLCKAFSQQTTASRQVTTFTIEAPQLQTEKKIWVYLPKDYTASAKRYPVIYMSDGQNLFDSKTADNGEWNVDETLDGLNAKVIVVGIEQSANDNSTAILAPFKHPKYGSGNADNYLDFIVNTLKPKIDASYRTKTNTRNTGIIGSSLGGLTSFYAALKYPEVFGKVGCFSPAFWFNRAEMTALMEQTQSFKTKVFFLCGSNADTISDIENVEYWVNTKRCECQKLNKKVIVKGGQDNEKLWRENFKKAYLWLF